MTAHCPNCLSDSALGTHAASICTECASVSVAVASVSIPVLIVAALAAGAVVFAASKLAGLRLRKPQLATA